MIVAIEIWVPNACYQCGVQLPKNAEAMKDTETDLIYCLDCGTELEEHDYTQYAHYTTTWS